MFDQMTLPGFGSATFSPASADGRSPHASPAGPTTASCGPDRARASRSRSRENAPAPTTNGTCGPTSFACSVPVGPLSGWESRLRQRLARIGSTECLLTWKASATPGGRSLSRLVPSMGRTVEIVCGLWPTPAARDWRSESASPEFYAAWAANPKGKTLPMQIALAMWPTTTTSDARRGSGTIRPQDAGIPLPQRVAQVMAATWPTPVANDVNKTPAAHMAMKARMKGGPRHCITSLQVMAKADGQITPGSSATTEKPGALNPAFVCWLMGFPPEWDACAPTATPSSRRSPRK